MGPRSDLYSLGCVAYWMLTGRTVFQKESAVAMMMAHIQTPPEPPSEIGVAVPECLERVVMACLEKNPEKRPRSAVELAQRLEACEARPAWTDADAAAWWAAHPPAAGGRSK
jgi:serine/threonine-protein kinase